MQSTRLSDSTVKTLDTAATEAETISRKSGPVELDLETLRHVGGGLSPKGTWGDSATATLLSSPKGTW
jgi:hypothetical protein